MNKQCTNCPGRTDHTTAECPIRARFEAYMLGREHPVIGWIDGHWFGRGDDPVTYANDYVQGCWVMWQARARLAAPMPPEIPRDLLGKIVDEVFDGAIEDTSVIEDVYRVIAREQQRAVPADCDAAFAARYNSDPADHAVAQDLAIWREAWAARPVVNQQVTTAASLPVGVPVQWSKSLGSCWPADEESPEGDWLIGTIDEDGNRFEVVRVEAAQYDAEGESQKIAEAIVALWSSATATPTVKESLSVAASDVLAERQRQITAEGWTPEHDDEHDGGELSHAASCYARLAHNEPGFCIRPAYWPWDKSWWKPSTPRHNLIKAGALILAEIERLDRAEQGKQELQP